MRAAAAIVGAVADPASLRRGEPASGALRAGRGRRPRLQRRPLPVTPRWLAIPSTSMSAGDARRSRRGNCATASRRCCRKSAAMLLASRSSRIGPRIFVICRSPCSTSRPISPAGRPRASFISAPSRSFSRARCDTTGAPACCWTPTASFARGSMRRCAPRSRRERAMNAFERTDPYPDFGPFETDLPRSRALRPRFQAIADVQFRPRRRAPGACAAARRRGRPDRPSVVGGTEAAHRRAIRRSASAFASPACRSTPIHRDFEHYYPRWSQALHAARNCGARARRRRASSVQQDPRAVVQRRVRSCAWACASCDDAPSG